MVFTKCVQLLILWTVKYRETNSRLWTRNIKEKKSNDRMLSRLSLWVPWQNWKFLSFWAWNFTNRNRIIFTLKIFHFWCYRRCNFKTKTLLDRTIWFRNLYHPLAITRIASERRDPELRLLISMKWLYSTTRGSTLPVSSELLPSLQFYYRCHSSFGQSCTI